MYNKLHTHTHSHTQSQSQRQWVVYVRVGFDVPLPEQDKCKWWRTPGVGWTHFVFNTLPAPLSSLSLSLFVCSSLLEFLFSFVELGSFDVVQGTPFSKENFPGIGNISAQVWNSHCIIASKPQTQDWLCLLPRKYQPQRSGTNMQCALHLGKSTLIAKEAFGEIFKPGLWLCGWFNLRYAYIIHADI